MRTRQPFYGDPEDAALLPDYELPSDIPMPTLEPAGEVLADGTWLRTPEEEGGQRAHHPDAIEIGTELPLGLIPHRGANRQQRLAAVANFEAEGADRRELWQQRQRQRRGTLDPELRRLQRRKAATK